MQVEYPKLVDDKILLLDFLEGLRTTFASSSSRR